MTDLSQAVYEYENGDTLVALDKKEFGEYVSMPPEFTDKGVPNGLRIVDNDIDKESLIRVEQLFGTAENTNHNYHIRNLDKMLDGEILAFEEDVDEEDNPLTK